MERRTGAKWLLVAALACFGFLGLQGVANAQEDGTTVQGTQASDDSTAGTGEVEGSNTSNFNAGPSAEGGSGASAQQLGNNTGSVSQSGTAKSGDPVAGSQVTGVVGSNATVQNQNSATNPSAISGDVTFENDASVNFGPSAVSADGPAQAAQIGDNRADVSQSFTGGTGDAVAGSQVTGIVGGGEHIVQNQNSVDGGGVAFSGDLELDNEVAVNIGPYAESDDDAQAGQIGSNDAVISQAVDATSGDAVFGSQVTGVVGGSATIQQQNAADGLGTEIGSGFVDVDNDVAITAGPRAVSFDGGAAQASQTGDNTADVLQDVQIGSGDAVGGSQVTGAVGDQGGYLVVQNQQASDDFFVVSGGADVNNDVDIVAGPSADAFGGGDAQASQIGDNDMAVAQTVEISTGDALAGAQVTGAVGYSDVTIQNQNAADNNTAVSGSIDEVDNDIDVVAGPQAETFAFAFGGEAVAGDAQASQFGDNTLVVDQAVTVATGDAVAGGQVTGVVATGSEVTIQNQNSGDGNVAISGDIEDIENDVDVVAGPQAESFAFVVDGVAVAGDAQASQIGDNTVVASQSVELGSGDAVAGAQVTGVVAGDGAVVTIQNQNSGDFNTAISGEVDEIENEVDVVAGPQAESTAVGIAFFFGADAFAGDAQAAQTGDNSVDVAQGVEIGSGDAVAGSQVTGVVAGDGSVITIQNQNSGEGNVAISGDVDDVDNEVDVVAGPQAESFAVAFGGNAFAGDAQASQIGDNSVDVAQGVEIGSGDAVAGSQVTGVVAGDGSVITIQNQNAAEGNVAISGDVDDVENEIDVVAGPQAESDAVAFGGNAFAGDAQASQNGDNSVVGSQWVEIGSGDAVAGSQVTGVVAGHGSDVTVQDQNTSDGDVAISGDVDDVDNEVDVVAGPNAGTFAEAFEGEAFFGDAQASQIGDNSVDVAQGIEIGSGDAVAGSQVTGVVAGDGSEITIQNQNTADGSAAFSGGVFGVDNDAVINAGPRAETAGEGDAQAEQIGDNSVVASQWAEVSSGDAVAGSQVTGVVAGEGSDTTIQNQNSSTDTFAGSGDVEDVENTLEVNAGPFAEAEFGDAQAQQFGDNSLVFAQEAVVTSGDAVAGSQVTGVVGGNEAVIQLQGSDDGSVALSGNVFAANVAFGGLTATAISEFGNADAQQIGDGTFDGTQDLDFGSGDAVSGAQVTGRVGSDGTTAATTRVSGTL